MWTLLAVVAAFGVSSSFDWTWFYPGLAVTALICAGWLAGRGAAPAARAAAAARPAPATPARRRSLSTRPSSIAWLTILLVGTIAVAWATWQPLASYDAANAGISAVTTGHAGQAIADARAASSDDPASLEPLQELSALYGAIGARAQARSQLVKATTLQPQNPLPWTWLGTYELQQGQPRLAVTALRRAARLDVSNAQVAQQLSRAEQQSGTAATQG
jgi:tetratricopeptide (TPR) repeat protein